MLTVLVFDRNGHRPVEDPEEISDLLRTEGTVVWADIRQPHDGELERLRDELDLHPLAIEDASKHGQRPKLELFGSHVFLVAYADAPDTRQLVEVDVFLGRNWLVTVHDRTDEGGHFDISSCQDRACRLAPEEPSAAYLLYTVLDQIVDTYFVAIDALGDEVDTLEERIFADHDPEADEMTIQRDMLRVRKRLLRFRRKVVPLREVLITLLRDDIPWIGPEVRQYVQDVFDHVMRVTDEIDTRRELIGNAVDAHLAMVANHQNQIMKKMTSWGAILIVATLIAGIYGMNFEEMPELHWRFGYYGALASMVLLTSGLYLYFKRKRWL